MLYIAQVIIYTAIMWLIYIVLLRNRPIHAFNRLYLLATAVFPLILPFLTVPKQTGAVINSIYNTGLQLPEVYIRPGNASITSFSDFTLLIYTGVTIILFTIAIIKLFRLHKTIKRTETEINDGYILLRNSGFGPGSWMRYIFLPEADADDRIIQHELAHIKLGHTYDVLLMQLLQIVAWPNLLLILIKKELRSVHEFQADAAVAGEKQEYAQMLVASVFGNCTLPYTHSFNIHPIKRRISMLNKKARFASALSGAIAIATTAFVAAAIIGIQSCQNKKWEIKKETYSIDMRDACRNSNAIHSGNVDSMMIAVIDRLPFTMTEPADKMPAFPNGQLTQYLIENIKYPEEARVKKIEGKVIMSFSVDTDGSLSDIHVGLGYERVNGKEKGPMPHPLLAAEAERVVKSMPKWIPGEKNGKKMAYRYLLPINFKLS